MWLSNEAPLDPRVLLAVFRVDRPHGAARPGRAALNSSVQPTRSLVQDWLAVHGRKSIAGRVLTSLLGQADVETNQWVLTAAQDWLAVHGNDASAFDLRKLIEQAGLA